jgi:serine/threonine protein kinase
MELLNDNDIANRFDADWSLIPANRIIRASDRIDGSAVILKFSKIDRENLIQYERNFNRLKTIDHPNIIRHRGIFALSENIGQFTTLEIIDYASLGTLADYLKAPVKLGELVNIFRQVFSAIDFLHQHKILHRDIKATNILLHHEHARITVKICDIEFLEVENSAIRTTPEFLAPEVSVYEDYTVGAEVWATGVMIYELFTGKFPFGSRLDGLSIEQIKENSRVGLTKFQVDRIPDPFRKVVELSLIYDHNERAQSMKPLRRAIGFLAVMKLVFKSKFNR